MINLFRGLAFLKNHPFAVEAFFKQSIVLTFAVPRKQIENLIPECLVLDTFNEWAFIAVALVQTSDLRPKGFPRVMGNDFFLIGYRIFVRYTNNDKKNLRGLYIIKSETDKRKMETLGNLFTHYNYTTTDISISKESNHTKFLSINSGLQISITQSAEKVPLPEHSPFKDWKEARRFAGPLPFTFTYNKNTKEVLIIEGVRKNWQPQAIEVNDCKISFLNSLKIKGMVLANAFIIEDVPYYWKKGKIEKWIK